MRDNTITRLQTLDMLAKLAFLEGASHCTKQSIKHYKYRQSFSSMHFNPFLCMLSYRKILHRARFKFITKIRFFFFKY